MHSKGVSVGEIDRDNGTVLGVLLHLSATCDSSCDSLVGTDYYLQPSMVPLSMAGIILINLCLE